MIRGVTTRPRPDPDARGGLRLTLAAVGGLVLAVPFGLLLLLVADRWGPLTRLDQRVAEALHGPALAHPSYVQALQAISLVLSPSVFQVVGVVVAVVLILRRQPRLAAWLVVTVVGSGLLDTAVKDLVGRRRPVFAVPVAHARSTSFPSGHAVGVVAGVGALLLVGLPLVAPALRRRLVLLGALVIVLVGFSRLGLGVHFLTDVIGGYVLGAAWLALTTALFMAWRRDLGRPARPLDAGLEPAVPERP